MFVYAQSMHALWFHPALLECFFSSHGPISLSKLAGKGGGSLFRRIVEQCTALEKASLPAEVGGEAWA